MLCVALALVAVGTIRNPDEDVPFGSSLGWLGILLGCVSTLFYSFQYVFEEKLFLQYKCNPVLVVGLEGGFGLTISVTAVMVAHFVGVENFVESAYQILHNTPLLAGIIGFLLSHLVLLVCGTLISYFSSGLLRSVLGPMQTIVIFVLEVTVLQWAVFEVITCAGIVLMVFAVLLFNNLVVIPRWNSLNRALNKPVVFACLTDPDAVVGRCVCI